MLISPTNGEAESRHAGEVRLHRFSFEARRRGETLQAPPYGFFFSAATCLSLFSTGRSINDGGQQLVMMKVKTIAAPANSHARKPNLEIG
jgi:hypothetical protein